MMSPPPLVVGIPREVKEGEHRVALTPDGAHELTAHGVSVLVEHDAGVDSAISDDEYEAAGAEIVASAADVWSRAGMILKVKEPQESELGHLRPGLVLFTYLHLAAYPAVAAALLEHEVTGIAYETVQPADGSLPLLAPMSEVAGRMATQVGARFLERELGGRGRAPGWCAGSPAGPGGGDRGRQRGLELGAGSRRAWKPRSCCSTRTSTGSGGWTRSIRVASSRSRATAAR